MSTGAAANTSVATLISLGAVSGYGYLFRPEINNEGVIVATAGNFFGPTTNYLNSMTVEAGFVWQNGVTTALPPLPGDFVSIATGINDSGEVVGESVELFNGGIFSQAVYWLNGIPHSLSLPDGVPYAVNNSGEIVGSENEYGPFVANAGTNPVPPYSIQPNAINDAGWIAGTSGTSTPNQSEAVLWKNGVTTFLPPLQGDPDSTAFGLNNKGEVVGYSGNFSQYDTERPVAWVNGTAVALGDGSLGQFHGEALAVNSGGIVAGWVTPSSTGHEVAAIWIDGIFFNLNTLLPSGQQGGLATATGINDAGQVVGYDGGSYVLTLPSVLPVSAGQAVQAAQSILMTAPLTVSDSVANIEANLGALTGMASAGQLAGLEVTDSAANIAPALDQLEIFAKQGKLDSVTLTDNGAPDIAISAAQSASDAAVLNSISGDFTLTVTLPQTSATVDGVFGRSATAVLPGNASQWVITPAGDGHSLTASSGAITDHLTNVTELQFSDYTYIVASQTPATAGAVSSAMVTELYGAVFGREPDSGGLAYYESYAAANPSTPFLQFAQFFLFSPEYAGNAAHKYAQSVAGNEQFITDSYNNLLHRSPSSAEVAFYENKVIAPALAGLTPGTSAYAAAVAQAHAQTLVYFSQSAEFLGDVQATGQAAPSAQHWLVLI